MPSAATDVMDRSSPWLRFRLLEELATGIAIECGRVHGRRRAEPGSWWNIERQLPYTVSFHDSDGTFG